MDVPEHLKTPCDRCGEREFIPSTYAGELLCKSCATDQYMKDMREESECPTETGN